MWKYFSMLLGGLCSLFLVLNSKQPQYRYPSVINCGRGLKRGYTEESLGGLLPSENTLLVWHLRLWYRFFGRWSVIPLGGGPPQPDDCNVAPLKATTIPFLNLTKLLCPQVFHNLSPMVVSVWSTVSGQFLVPYSSYSNHKINQTTRCPLPRCKVVAVDRSISRNSILSQSYVISSCLHSSFLLHSKLDSGGKNIG